MSLTDEELEQVAKDVRRLRKQDPMASCNDEMAEVKAVNEVLLALQKFYASKMQLETAQ